MKITIEQEMKWLLQEKYNGQSGAEYEADCVRLKAGEPLAYLIGHLPFLNTTIWLDSHPLIPRPETEYWVNELITSFRKRKYSPKNILDLGAGSGCIGIALGKEFTSAAITFVELENRHSATLEKNCAFNKLEKNRYQIFVGDLFTPILDQPTFDLIVSNPPYIDASLKRTATSVIKYEPPLALYGGSGGMAIIEKIIIEAPHWLNPHGELWLEHEPEQTETITSLALNYGFRCHTQTDQFGTLRYSQLVLQ